MDRLAASLASLLRDQVDQAERHLAISRAQYAVLARAIEDIRR